MEFNKFQINIPANIKTRMELINGIGIKELIYTAIAFCISLVIGIIYNAIYQNKLVTIGICAISTALVFVSVMKDKYNNSIAGYIKNIIVYFKNQKFFKFVKEEHDV